MQIKSDRLKPVLLARLPATQELNLRSKTTEGSQLRGEDDTLIGIKDYLLESEQQKRLRAARRAVIKLGTGIVTSPDGQFNVEHLAPVARTIARLKKDGRQIVLVSSGAVGLGRGRLGLHRDRLNDMVMRQALSLIHI